MILYILNCKCVPLHHTQVLMDIDIDRQNLAVSKLQGIMVDLDLTTQQFATCVSVLFAGYLPFQIPSNYIISRIPRPGLCESRVLSEISVCANDCRYLLRCGLLGSDLCGHGCCAVLLRIGGDSSRARCSRSRVLPW